MPQNTNIVNVHADAQDTHFVQARIDSKVFEYFFRRCLTGDRGPRQAFITFFYQKFYEACVLDGIAPIWDESNEQRINAVLQRLNFIDQHYVVPADDTTKRRGPGRKPVRPRRANPSSTVNTPEPASSEHVDGGINSPSPAT